jgi:hypothetical protein
MEPKMEERKAESDQLVAIASDRASQTAEKVSPEYERKQEDSYGSCGWFGEAPTYACIIDR